MHIIIYTSTYTHTCTFCILHFTFCIAQYELHIHTLPHTHTYTHMHNAHCTCIHTPTYTPTHTPMHMLIYTSTYTHAYTHFNTHIPTYYTTHTQIYESLNIVIALIGVEVWTRRDRMTAQIPNQSDSVMKAFLEYRKRSITPQHRHDNAQLLT